jgi:hypothetical protein
VPVHKFSDEKKPGFSKKPGFWDPKTFVPVLNVNPRFVVFLRTFVTLGSLAADLPREPCF